MGTTLTIIISVAAGFVLERVYNALNKELTYQLKIFMDWRREDKAKKSENDKEIAAFKKYSDRRGRLSRSKRQGQRYIIRREPRRVLPD